MSPCGSQETGAIVDIIKKIYINKIIPDSIKEIGKNNFLQTLLTHKVYGKDVLSRLWNIYHFDIETIFSKSEREEIAIKAINILYLTDRQYNDNYNEMEFIIKKYLPPYSRENSLGYYDYNDTEAKNENDLLVKNTLNENLSLCKKYGNEKGLKYLSIPYNYLFHYEGQAWWDNAEKMEKELNNDELVTAILGDPYVKAAASYKVVQYLKNMPTTKRVEEVDKEESPWRNFKEEIQKKEKYLKKVVDKFKLTKEDLSEFGWQPPRKGLEKIR